MKDFLIKMLGGMTRTQHLEEMEHLRKVSEQFAKDYLCAKSGITLQGDGFIEYADCELDFVVTGSRTRVNNCRLGGLYVAPWIEYASFIGLSISSSNLFRKSENNTNHPFIYWKGEHLDFLAKASYSSQPAKEQQNDN